MFKSIWNFSRPAFFSQAKANALKYPGVICQEKRRIDPFLEELLETNLDSFKDHIQDNDLSYSVDLFSNLAHYNVQNDSIFEALLGGITFKLEQLTPELAVDLTLAIKKSRSLAFRSLIKSIYMYFQENTSEFTVPQALELRRTISSLDKILNFDFEPNFDEMPKGQTKIQKSMAEIGPQKTLLRLHGKKLEVQVDRANIKYYVRFLDEPNSPSITIQGYEEGSFESIKAIRLTMSKSGSKNVPIYLDDIEVSRSLLITRPMPSPKTKKINGKKSGESFNDFLNDLLALEGQPKSRLSQINDDLTEQSVEESGKWKISNLSREMLEHYTEQKYEKNKELYKVDSLQKIVRPFCYFSNESLEGRSF